MKKIVDWIHQETGDIEREEITEDELGQSALHGLEPSGFGNDDEDDPLYDDAKRIITETQKASSSLLQRRLKVGYARAARLIDILEERGIVGHADGAKPREVFARADDYEEQNALASSLSGREANVDEEETPEESEEDEKEDLDEEESKDKSDWTNPKIGT